MKQILLLLCLLPGLLYAQNVSQRNAEKGRKHQSFLTIQQSKNSLRANAQLLDSVYVYSDDTKEIKYIYAYTYDSEGRIATEKTYGDFAGDGKPRWDGDFSFSYSKDGNNLIQEKIMYNPFGSKNPFYKEIITFNVYGNMINTVIYYYNDINADWELNRKTTIKESDANGNPTLILDSAFLYTDDVYKDEYTYNADNKLIKELNYTKVPTKAKIETNTDIWELDSEKEYTYNTDGNFQTKSYKAYYRGEMYSSLLSTFTYDEKGNVLTETGNNGYTTTLFTYKNIYSDGSAINVSPIKIDKLISVYPNPVTDYLVINMSEVSNANMVLVNGSGATVLRQEIRQQVTTVPVISYPKGFYILTVNTDKGSESFKLILK